MSTVPRSDLDAAVREGILSASQADRLAAFLASSPAAAAEAERPRFSFVHVLYYLGGMIAIGAMSLFMTLGWNALGGWGGFFTAVLYGVLGVGAVLLWRYRLPFMLMPIAVTLWYMSMDLVPFLFGDWRDWEIRKFISLWFGLAMVLLAFWVDVRSRHSRD